MSFLDRLLGREEQEPATADGTVARQQPARGGAGTTGGAAARDPDAAAIERYHYLLRTAPPETIEQAHAEAFARLTPEQRRQVLEQISQGVPPAERPAGDDPRTLARAATRAEVRDPGFLDRTLGGRDP
ncbi:MAG TPA: hypothetical protein VM490_00795, partial [Armatimonadaceae bacterium]|nr:hypothetical protein [Armatimonadaceae bacterium]